MGQLPDGVCSVLSSICVLRMRSESRAASPQLPPVPPQGPTSVLDREEWVSGSVHAAGAGLSLPPWEESRARGLLVLWGGTWVL